VSTTTHPAFPVTGWAALPALDELLDPLLPDELADEPEPWTKRALCAQTDPDAFFPEKGGSTREAKRICLDCEVKDECLNYALAHDERFGIWGGLSERERRKFKKQLATVDEEDQAVADVRSENTAGAS
jgi:hypothetical protein